MKCAILECTNTLSDHHKSPICSLCRGSIHRWEKRRPAEVMERRRKLHMYDRRMVKVEEGRAPKQLSKSQQKRVVAQATA